MTKEDKEFEHWKDSIRDMEMRVVSVALMFVGVELAFYSQHLWPIIVLTCGILFSYLIIKSSTFYERQHFL